MDALTRTNGRRLPAGPFREGYGELARANVVVIVRRASDPGPSARLLDRLGRQLPGVALAACHIQPTGLAPFNRPAEVADAPRPSVGLTAVMKPRLFFDRLDVLSPDIETRIVLTDHASPSAELVDRIKRTAKGRGLVATLKDVVKLRELIGDAVPLWAVDERIEWESGRSAIQSRLLSLCERDPRGGTHAT